MILSQPHKPVFRPRRTKHHAMPMIHRAHSTMPLLIILFQTLWIGHVSCLAASPSSNNQNLPSPQRRSIIISTHVNGGRPQIVTRKEDKGVIQYYNSQEESTDGSDIRNSPHRGKLRFSRILPTVASGIRSTFLPAGYPAKVPSGYLRYAAWSWIQDLSTQLRAVLATQHVLEGVGVGRPGATALSAMLNFLVRDGCGMAATLLFTATAASRFQSNVKKWRLFADIMVDLGITLEVASRGVPQQWFLPLLCVANVCKAMCGVAGGAVGGAINLYWAAKGTDISDIAAKFGAQQTVTASLGLVFAAMFARSLSTVDARKMWILYLSLTALHIFANMQCMRIMAFDTLNVERMEILFRKFYDQYQNAETTSNFGVKLLTPQQVASCESLFFWPKWGKNKISNLAFGVSFNELLTKEGDEQDLLSSDSINQPYWIASSSGTTRSNKKHKIKVALNAQSTPRQVIRAYFEALWIGARNVQHKTELLLTQQDDAWNVFCHACEEAGWNMDKHSILTKGYEVSIETS